MALAIGAINGIRPVLFDAGTLFNMLGFVLRLRVRAVLLRPRPLCYQAMSGASSMPIVLWRSYPRSSDRSPDTWDRIWQQLPGVEGAQPPYARSRAQGAAGLA